jgi:hypothetical protein
LIDSLRWQELNIWIRILQGEIPEETTVSLSDSTADELGYQLSNSEPWWEAQVTVSAKEQYISRLDITDASGYRHQVELQRPVKWPIADSDSVFTLLDLPGTRLDLR